MLSLLGNNPFPINNPLLSVIPPAPACRGRACDFFPPQKRVVPKERALSKEGVRTNDRAIPWQQSYAYNDPLLFVIPSEAEGICCAPFGCPVFTGLHLPSLCHPESL